MTPTERERERCADMLRAERLSRDFQKETSFYWAHGMACAEHFVRNMTDPEPEYCEVRKLHVHDAFIGNTDLYMYNCPNSQERAELEKPDWPYCKWCGRPIKVVE